LNAERAIQVIFLGSLLLVFFVSIICPKLKEDAKDQHIYTCCKILKIFFLFCSDMWSKILPFSIVFSPSPCSSSLVIFCQLLFGINVWKLLVQRIRSSLQWI
jgi:hypothetical protein